MKSFYTDKDILPGQMNFIDFLEEYNEEKEVDIRGICDDGYCPTCGVWVEDLADRCMYCNQKLSWERWKKLNES